MPVPSSQALDQRAAKAEERLRRLRESYTQFVKEWESIQHEEFQLLRSLHDDVDKQQLHAVLEKISTIHD